MGGIKVSDLTAEQQFELEKAFAREKPMLSLIAANWFYLKKKVVVL
jgi:hypothetical protein